MTRKTKNNEVVVINLVLISSAFANQTYICNLTQSDLNDIKSHYELPSNTVYTDVEAPFNCAAFGTLCTDVGPALAEDFICARFDDLTAHANGADFWSNVKADLKDLVPHHVGMYYHEDFVFPNGPPSAASSQESTIIASEMADAILVGGLIVATGSIYIIWELGDDDTGLVDRIFSFLDPAGPEVEENSTGVWCPPSQQPECLTGTTTW